MSPTLILSFFFELKISLISTVFFCQSLFLNPVNQCFSTLVVWNLCSWVTPCWWAGHSHFSRPICYKLYILIVTTFTSSICIESVSVCLLLKKLNSALSIYLLFSKSVCLYLEDVFKYKRPSKDHDSFQVFLRQNKKVSRWKNAHQHTSCPVSYKTSAAVSFSLLLRIILMPCGTGLSIRLINILV